jgi:hypothetical protein
LVDLALLEVSRVLQDDRPGALYGVAVIDRPFSPLPGEALVAVWSTRSLAEQFAAYNFFEVKNFRSGSNAKCSD